MKILVSIVMLSGAALSSAQFTALVLPDYDMRWQTTGPDAGAYPEGNFVLGGVPFATPVGGANGMTLTGSGTVTKTVAANVANATKVHILLNTFWGTTTPGLADIEFLVDGNTYTKSLVGGQDMRDWLDNVYTNTINGTTTVNVFSSGRARWDMLTYELPVMGTLESVKFVDRGQDGIQRMVTAGVTVESVPEPATMALVGTGALVLLRRKRK